MGLRRHCSLFLVLAGVFILSAKVAQGVTLEIAIRPSFGGEPLLLDSLRYKNAAGETLSISRLSYLLALQRHFALAPAAAIDYFGWRN